MSTPPAAPRRPHRIEAHGDVRIDDWYWLADRDDPAVLAHLEAENAYTNSVLSPTGELQDRIFEEIKGHVVETDASAPVRDGPWWYWSRTVEGLPYRIMCRRHDPERRLDAAIVLADARNGRGDEEVILDENACAAGSESFAIGVLEVSPDHRLLAYGTDHDGSERYALRFRDLGSGADLDEVIEEVSYGSAWAADNRTFFYTRTDEAMRPYQVWRHTVGTPAGDDVLAYENLDERFWVSVGVTRSKRFVVVEAGSKMTAGALYVDAADPERPPAEILPIVEGVEYEVEHAVWPGAGDVWLIRSNRPGPTGEASTDFRLDRVRIGGGPDDLEPVLAHRPGVRLVDVDAFATHLVVTERSDGLEQLRIVWPATGEDRLVPQPDPVFSLLGEANPEWDSAAYRFGYTSLVTPPSTIELDVGGGGRTVVRVQPVNGYDPTRFRTERVWAEAADGTAVPISLVARADVAADATAPMLLYGYGAYEITIDPSFSTLRLSLLERGVVFAIAHIRGGGEMGRAWYEHGRLGEKPNSFSDFVSCAEHLIATGRADPSRIAIRGGSAGGLLMGAVTNLRPDLWAAVVAEVPFVDVVTTMSDPSLPLTVTEWEEWGNPIEDPAAYRVMRGYSPYDNVAAVAYPPIYATGGLNDPRVGYWEPAKWVAKLRSEAAGGGPFLLRTELDAGHRGPSGRYAMWRDEAKVYAFLLSRLGAGT